MTEQLAEKNAVMFTGGGARAAYQVGVLRAIAEWLPAKAKNPFPIITGSSAGAINAASLASGAFVYQQTVRKLEAIWSQLEVSQVFHSDAGTIYKTAAHWLLALTVGGMGKKNPLSLLDNAPFKELLEKHIPFAQIPAAINHGVLEALSITASSYGAKRSVSFFTAKKGVQGWVRHRRSGRSAHISSRHLMGSVALPVLFPAMRIGEDYFGDGSMRDIAPLSSAIHLGASRILVIGTRNNADEKKKLNVEKVAPEYPSLGQLAGYILDTLFMDSLSADLERINRSNELIASSPRSMVTEDGRILRPIEPLVILPSQDLSELAVDYYHCFTRPVRHLLSGMGAFKEGSPLPSYLLFDGRFAQKLIALGYADAMDQRVEISSHLRISV